MTGSTSHFTQASRTPLAANQNGMFGDRPICIGRTGIFIGRSPNLAFAGALQLGQQADVPLANIPVPDEPTPWEAILEFRGERANRAAFANLRRFIVK
jgi:hypothetical protein